MLTILTGPDRQAGLSQLIDTICARAAEGIGEQILIVPERILVHAQSDFLDHLICQINREAAACLRRAALSDYLCSAWIHGSGAVGPSSRNSLTRMLRETFIVSTCL